MPRKSCKILLDYHSGFEGKLQEFTYENSRFLTAFETVVLAIANDYTPETKHELRARMYNPRPDPRRDMEAAMHCKDNRDTRRAYRRAKKALGSYLGPAERVHDGKGAHLEFHPLAFQSILDTEGYSGSG